MNKTTAIKRTTILNKTILWVIITGAVMGISLVAPKFSVALFGKSVSLQLNGALRILFLIHPASIIGVTAASYINLWSSILANPMYLLMPSIYGGLGLMFHAFSRKWGRKWYKDITLAAVFFALHASLILINAAIVKSTTGYTLYHNFSLSTLSFRGFIIEVIAKVIFCVSCGYPVVLAIDRLKAANFKQLNKSEDIENK